MWNHLYPNGFPNTRVVESDVFRGFYDARLPSPVSDGIDKRGYVED
jgi:hypothetical protein